MEASGAEERRQRQRPAASSAPRTCHEQNDAQAAPLCPRAPRVDGPPCFSFPVSALPPPRLLPRPAPAPRALEAAGTGERPPLRRGAASADQWRPPGPPPLSPGGRARAALVSRIAVLLSREVGAGNSGPLLQSVAGSGGFHALQVVS
ncbi:hypothetical protein NDU88_008914 [Pleurodeles waltl]|uniref:Uncharacterized protein n=1 Tax=Pleurodeles waltl TaxID=8319 RepID=A0AAV7RXK8_PLEWA|nr:hypothetical protein NDU88_008914 [Pleurodeles waltl]